MEICILLVLVIAVTAIATLLSSPPDLPKVSLTSFTVTKFNFTGDHISGYLIMQFQVLNPNLETHLFYNFNCSVYHGKHRLASTVSPHFVQRSKETTQINVVVHLTPGTTGLGRLWFSRLRCEADYRHKMATLVFGVHYGFVHQRDSSPPACGWWSRQDDWSGKDMPGDLIS